MGINTSWQTTLAFRDFRSKTFELSRVYWTQQLSADSLLQQLSALNPSDIASEVIQCSFDAKMHPEKVSDTIAWIPGYMSRNRLHLLVLYTSFLETYLKEITFYHSAAIGHIANLDDVTKPLKLTDVGNALTRPILNSSTVPDMISYASEYFGIDFGINANEWGKFYKIRCAAAHNGGIATPNFLSRISGQPLALNPKAYDNIGLTWDELRAAMKYGDEIAALIDSKVSSYEIKMLETEGVLRELKAKKTLPPYEKLWEFLHTNYSLFQIKKKQKLNLIAKYYGVKL